MATSKRYAIALIQNLTIIVDATSPEKAQQAAMRELSRSMNDGGLDFARARMKVTEVLGPGEFSEIDFTKFDFTKLFAGEKRAATPKARRK